jgi:hypothetical protein
MVNDRPVLTSDMAPHDGYNRSGLNLQIQNIVMGPTGSSTSRRTDRPTVRQLKSDLDVSGPLRYEKRQITRLENVYSTWSAPFQPCFVLKQRGWWWGAGCFRQLTAFSGTDNTVENKVIRGNWFHDMTKWCSSLENRK